MKDEHRSVRGAASVGGRLWLLGASVTVVTAAVVFWSMTQSAVDTQKPDGRSVASTAPLDRTTSVSDEPRDRPAPPAEPQAPPDVEKIRAKAYAEAVERGDAHPALTAFRQVSEAFVEYNRQLADALAQEEGITYDEVKELTFFGLMVQHSLRWPGVEAVLGHPVEDAARASAEQLMHELNMEFKASMRELVKSGGTREERQQLIDDVQRRYREGYFETTGMNDELLEDLLAGDLGRKYPMSQLPPPEKLAERAPLDDPQHMHDEPADPQTPATHEPSSADEDHDDRAFDDDDFKDDAFEASEDDDGRAGHPTEDPTED
ncbi:MAG: hypothetical protein AAFN74_01715 [Myxococcota bacterium]